VAANERPTLPDPEERPYRALLRRGVSRRAFLKFSAAMAATLALPLSYGPRIAAAVENAPRIPLIWLRGLACGGDSQAFLQPASPHIGELLVSMLSLEFDEALMAAAGADASAALSNLRGRFPNGYIAIVEGAIPTAEGGVHCTVGGRPLRDVANEVCAGALGTIAVGSCAFDGGACAAHGGLTGAAGVGQIVTTPKLVNLPGCPVNGDNLAATLVHYLTANEFPPTDGRGRPYFAYGGLVHNQCERRAHFEFGEFVQSWGDEASQKGWCLYKMGCKGPQTFANCPTQKYAESSSWNVLAGHGCIGCTMPGFWDGMGGAYQRLPAPLPFLPDISSDTLGLVLTGGVAGLAVVHGAASTVRQWRVRTSKRPIKTPEPAVEPMPQPIEAAVAMPAAEPKVEATTEPTAEPPVEAATEPIPEPALEPTPEPVSEPAQAAQPITAIDAAFALGEIVAPPDALEGRPSADDPGEGAQ
jgi:hydrogenase small subunit